ncbi:MAG: TlpA family protein disulfide reductase [Ginsengibacter sp.]
MNLKNLLEKAKKKWISILFYGLLAFVIISPTAKSWLLRQVVSTGLLKANIQKAAPDNSLQQAPTFLFTDVAGKTVSTEDLKGKVVFINFWASWCPPCRAEMPDLGKLYEKLKDDNRFVFLFMNEDQDRNAGLRYLDENHFSMPFYVRAGDISNEIFSGSLPTTVVLDKEGKIMLKHEGMAKYNSESFLRQLRELL